MAMIDIKDISVDPVTGKSRKVKFCGLDDFQIVLPMGGDAISKLELRFEITSYEEDGSIYKSDRVINPYQKKFVADNSTSVNAEGQYVADDAPDRVCGEYDFLKTALKTQPAVPLIEAFIDEADSMHRFD